MHQLSNCSNILEVHPTKKVVAHWKLALFHQDAISSWEIVTDVCMNTPIFAHHVLDDTCQHLHLLSRVKLWMELRQQANACTPCVCH